MHTNHSNLVFLHLYIWNGLCTERVCQVWMLSTFKLEGLDVKQYGDIFLYQSMQQHCKNSNVNVKFTAVIYRQFVCKWCAYWTKKFLHIGIQTSAFNMELFSHALWKDNSKLTYSYPNRICCSSHYSSRCQHWMLAHRL